MQEKNQQPKAIFTLTDKQRDDLNTKCRQLYLYYVEAYEKCGSPKCYLSEKQVNMLHALICKIRDGGDLDEAEDQRANQCVMTYWHRSRRHPDTCKCYRR